MMKRFSNFAFNFSLRPYAAEEGAGAADRLLGAAGRERGGGGAGAGGAGAAARGRPVRVDPRLTLG